MAQKAFDPKKEADDLKNELRRLENSLSSVAKTLDRAQNAHRITQKDIQVLVENKHAASDALQLQTSVTANLDSEMQLNQLQKEYNFKLQESDDLRREEHELQTIYDQLFQKNQYEQEQANLLMNEREKNQAAYELMSRNVSELQEKTAQMNKMYMAAVRAGEQQKVAFYSQVAQLESEVGALRQQNEQLTQKYDQHLKCNVQDAVVTVKQAAGTIDSLNQKVISLTNQLQTHYESQAQLQAAAEASIIARSIDMQRERQVVLSSASFDDESILNDQPPPPVMQKQQSKSSLVQNTQIYTPNAAGAPKLNWQ